jgi:hypothetical protein
MKPQMIQKLGRGFAASPFLRTARTMLRAATFALMLFAVLGPTPGFGAPPDHVPDEVLVRFRADSDPVRRGALHAAARATVVREFATVKNLQLVKLARGTSMAQALEDTAAAPTCSTSSRITA